MPQWVDDFTPKPYVPQWVDDPPVQPNYQPPPSSYQPPAELPFKFVNPPMNEPQKAPEQSTWNWWLEQAARNIPPVVGGFVGGVLGLPEGGIGAIPGAMAGGAAGSAFGNLAGNWVSGKEFQPAEFAVDTALGAIPPIFGPPKVAGAGLKELLKYGAKSAGMGALEGGLVSAGSTPFQHAARTGSFDAPLEEYAQNVGTGAGMGAVLGGGMGYFHGRGEQAHANAPIPPAPPLETIRLPEQPANPNIAPNLAPPSSQGPHLITIKDYSVVPYWKERGYVIVPGLKSADNYQQMARADVAPLYRDYKNSKIKPTELTNDEDVLNLMDQMRSEEPPSEVTPSQPAGQYTRENVPGAIGEGYVAEGAKEVTIPNDIVNGPFIQNMRESGFQIADKTPTHTIFKPLDPNMHIEEPPVNPNLDELFDRLRASIPPDESRGVSEMAGPPRLGPQNPEVLPRERTRFEETFGLEPGQELTPEQEANIKAHYEGELVASHGHDVEEGQNALDQARGDIRTISGEDERYAAGVKQAHDEGYIVVPRTNSDLPQMKAAGYQLVRRLESGELVLKPPQMNVPNEGGIDVAGMRQRGIFSPDRPAFNDAEPLFPPRTTSEMAYNPQRDPTGWLPGQGSTIPESASKPMVERANQLRKLQDEAYRSGDIKQAVALGQEIDHIETLIGRTGTRDMNRMRNPSYAQAPDETIRMEIGSREEMLRNQQGTYAEHGGRVANKELLQNAIDATPNGGTVEVKLDHANGSITVKDEGPGLPIDMIRNEYVTLTGSGKRGVGAASGRKSIGEMGVGKATYLLGVDKFEVHTIAKEPDGTTWKYEFKGNADSMIGKDEHGNDVPPVAVKKTKMPDGTPTGTEVTVHDKDPDNLKAAEDYLKTFAAYSDSPVHVKLTGDKRPNSYAWQTGLNQTVSPRTTAVGQHVSSGSAPGADYQIFVPTNAKWSENTSHTTAILTSRGMFQGAQQVYLGGTGNLPDRVVVNIEPTVSAQKAKLYPLTSPTREKMKDPFKNVIEEQLKEHLTKAAEKARQDDLKAAYANLVPDVNARTGKPLDFVIHDSGDRYTPAERAKLVNSPHMQAVAGTMKQMLDHLNAIFPHSQTGGKTDKYGFLIDGDNKGGMNVPDLIIRDNNAVLVNPMSAIQRADTPQIAAARLMHITAHEFNHNIERSEGGDFTWSFADVLSKLSPEEQVAYKNNFLKAITGPDGNYAPEVQNLLQDYTAARGRPDTTVDLLTRSAEGRFAQSSRPSGIPSSNQSNGAGVALAQAGGSIPPGNKPPVPPPGSSGGGGFFRGTLGWGQGATKGGTRVAKDEVNWVREAMAVPSSVTTTGDLSFPGRQGLSLIFTPQFWQAAGKMFKGGLSQAGFDAMNAELAKKPLMAKRLNTKTGKMDQSLGEELGLKIYKLASQAGPHAEGIASRWLERGIGKTTKDPLGNKTWQPTTGSKAWENTFGIPVKAANRAFLTMLNHLSVNRAEFLMNKARDMSIQGLTSGSVRPGIFGKTVNKNEAMDLNPYYNKVLGKEIIDFVNTATGHGPLRTHLLPAKQTEINLEGASKVLSSVLFSPGLLASRVRFMNPSTYIMASPYVRKQYMKSALSTVAAWYGFTEMAKLAGGDEVEVSNDPTSADFGKVRIGDTRLDPGGGFLQFAVAYSRLYQGGATSSSTGQFHKFGEGYQAQTSEDMMERFMVNKLNPVTKFAYDVASASEYNPFHVGDRTIQMFVPLFIQDLMEISKEDPTLLPAMGTAAMFGMGTQIYSKGESVGKIVPPENDWLVQGGGIRDLWGGGQ